MGDAMICDSCHGTGMVLIDKRGRIVSRLHDAETAVPCPECGGSGPAIAARASGPGTMGETMRQGKPRGEPLTLDKQAEARMQRFAAALRSGEVRLVAELEGTKVVVPQSLLRGNWQLSRYENYLCATDNKGNEVGPRYYRPIVDVPGAKPRNPVCK